MERACMEEVNRTRQLPDEELSAFVSVTIIEYLRTSHGGSPLSIIVLL
jgi:hypothetical protein